MGFIRDTKLHEMECIKADGIHRHYRFSKPNSSAYWFDIVTFPGYLVMTGDMGTWPFRRIRDMVQFFNKDRIDRGYWAEKLQMGSGRNEVTGAYKEVDLPNTLKDLRKILESWYDENKHDVGQVEKDELKSSYNEFASRLGRVKSYAEDYSCGSISENVFYRAVEEADLTGESQWQYDSPWDYEDLYPQFNPTYHFSWACEAIQYACHRIANKEVAEAAVDKFLNFSQLVSFPPTFIADLKLESIHAYGAEGYVFNDTKKRFVDGAPVQTSQVINIDTYLTDGYIQTVNSVYRIII